MKRLYVSQRTSHYSTGGPRRWFQVHIHTDPDELLAAARRYGRDLDDSQGQVLGCCHPAPTRERYIEGEWIKVDPSTWAGVVRLCQDHLTTEIVAHEMAHAALVIYRMDVCNDVRLGNGVGEREETLAHITGDLIGAASSALHDAGLWS